MKRFKYHGLVILVILMSTGITSAQPDVSLFDYWEYHSDHQEMTVDLYDASGRLAGQLQTREGSVDISRYPAGIYYLKIRSGHSVHHAKLLINR